MSVVRQNLAADVIARAVAATDNISGFRGNIWKLLSELEDVGGATLVRLSSHVCLRLTRMLASATAPVLIERATGLPSACIGPQCPNNRRIQLALRAPFTLS